VESIREIPIVARAELYRMVRSARTIVLLVLYCLFSTLVLLIVGSVARAFQSSVNRQIGGQADPEAIQRAFAEARRGVLGILLSGDAAILEALKEIPLVVVIVFKVSLLFLPAYVALIGFDQMSGELSQRSIRYLTVRARRSSILFGKFAAQAALLLGLVLLVDLGIFLYAKATNDDFTAALAAKTLLRFWIAAIVFSLAYLSLTSLCSALFRAPALSLVVNFAALFGFWLLDAIGQPDTALAPLRYLSPSQYSANLLHPRVAEFAISAGAYAGFGAGFLCLAYLVMRGRDL
jgi:ABC-type transport system involved in multi-copper enzyme maturation permease subunit